MAAWTGVLCVHMGQATLQNWLIHIMDNPKSLVTFTLDLVECVFSLAVLVAFDH